MRNLRVAGVLVALAAALVASPVQADDSGLSLQLSIGWDGGAVAGSWIPYQVTVRNFSSARDFGGTVVIRPRGPTGGTAGTGGAGYGTTYAQPLAVVHASQKTVTIFGSYLDVSGGGSGYIAELEDRSGAMVARSPIAVLNPGRLAIGLLSDSLQAAGQIKDVSLQATSTGVVQLTPQTLPATAVLLGGLGAIVIDNFDTSALSQAQDQALEQYVGLGGQLVLVGGSTWRRTLSQLPPALVPLRPEGTAAASLDAVLDLFGEHSDLIVPAVVGPLAPAARAVLSDAAGSPLVAELNYGAGRVVEVTYDPAEEPIASRPREIQGSWAAVLDRVIPPAPGNRGQGSGGGLILAPAPGQLQIEPGNVDEALGSLLNDNPANSLPPLGILGGLLIVYLVIAGPLNYGVLRRLRKRELTWVTVPLIAVVFTAGSYGIGTLVHGRDYFVNEIQVLRVTPGGGLDVAGYEAVYSPSRGDLEVVLPASSLASTYLNPVLSGLSPGPDDRVITGPEVLVSLRNVAIWTARDFKSEASARSPIAVEAHLRVESGRVSGTVSNRGRTTIRRLSLFATDGKMVELAAQVPPGSTLAVSAVLTAPAGIAAAPALGDKTTAVMTSAAQAITSQTSQVQALAGMVDGLPGFRVSGRVPTRSSLAVFALPVVLESVDSLPANWSAPRIVAGNGPSGNPVTVVDYELPRMPATVQLRLSASNASPIVTPALPGPKPQVEIFDWTAATWSAVDLSHPFALSAAERGPDLVRLRVRGNLYLHGLQVTSAK